MLSQVIGVNPSLMLVAGSILTLENLVEKLIGDGFSRCFTTLLNR